MLAGSVEFDARKLTAVGERLGLRMVVLFGSRATGSPPPAAESDLDLAVAFSSGHSVSWWDAHRELSAVFPAHVVDLVFLADADALFRWEILGAGVLLRGDPIEHLELRAFAFRDFVDSADLRRLERVLFEKKLACIKRQLHAAT